MFQGKEGGGRPTGYTDLAVDMFHMGSDGPFGYEESPGRLPPIEAFRYQTEHVDLSISEPRRPLLRSSVRAWKASGESLLSTSWRITLTA